jgi:N utilization substance protein B
MDRGKPTRRTARQATVQMLFETDVNPSVGIERVRAYFHEQINFDKLEQVAVDWFSGVLERRAEIDRVIGEHSPNWSIGRMPPIDRNILRLAVFELKYRPDTPPKAVINEAIELCKIYSTADSARFVNGLLDAVAGLRGRVAEAPSNDAPNDDRADPSADQGSGADE